MKVLLLAILFFTGTSGHQTAGRYPVKKIYAYRQSVSGGANNVISEPKKENQRYFLYVHPWSGREINIVQVWLEGEAFAFTTQNITTPVRQKESVSLGRKRNTRTLVPGNGSNVVQIQLGEATNGAVYPAHLKRFPVLLQYEWEGKTYFLGGSWKQLPAVVRQ